MVDTDEVPDNHVIDELQRGYRLKDRLLRPAMVRVAQKTRTKLAAQTGCKTLATRS